MPAVDRLSRRLWSVVRSHLACGEKATQGDTKRTHNYGKVDTFRSWQAVRGLDLLMDDAAPVTHAAAESSVESNSTGVQRPAVSTPRTGSLGSGVVILLLITIVQRGIGFVRSLSFCRSLDPDQLGQWDLAFSFLVLAAPLAVLGLPGSFGRYVEYFRQRGALRLFIARTALIAGGLSIATIALMAVAQERVAQWVFGTGANPGLLLWLLVCLVTVIAFNFLTSLLTALRQYQLISRMQLSQTLLFAGVSAALLAWWQPRVESVVAAYALACGLTIVGVSVALVRLWREQPPSLGAMSYGDFAFKLAPFAFWLWVTNWAANSFEMVDRWMLVHYGGFDAAEALERVGQYHSARVLPLLLYGVADTITNTLTPHLSADWEAGRREQVANRLNLALKLIGIGFTLVSIAVLWFSPLLFHVALHNRFAGGEAILGWTLAYSVWTAWALLSYNYLWCAEKSHSVCVSLLVGLAISVGLNLWLIPQHGLVGAVWSQTAAKFVALVVLAALCHRAGWKLDRRLLSLLFVPLLLPCGGVATLVGLAVVTCGLGPLPGVFTSFERRELMGHAEKLARRLGRVLPQRLLRSAQQPG